MDDSIAKLAKLSKVPLVIYNLCGGYGTDPRWGGKIRRGTKYTGRVKRIIYPDEYKDMSVAELSGIIKTELDVDDAASGERYTSRRRAEYIERALYMCPVCGAVGSIYSRGTHFECKNCHIRAEYTEDLHISPPVCGYDRIYGWYEWERGEIVKLVAGGRTVSDEGILFRESVKFKRKVKLGGDRVAIDSRKLTVSGGGKNYVYPLDEIDAITAVGKKKFNFIYSPNDFTDWSDVASLRDQIRPDHLLVAVGARHGTLSYHSDMDLMPKLIERYFATNSLLIVFPDQYDINKNTTAVPGA